MTNKPLNTLIDLELIDGIWEKFAVYDLININNGQEAITVIYNNGIKILFIMDVFYNIGCRVSYDRGNNYNAAEEWELSKFMGYMKLLRAMTKDEVQKRVKNAKAP